MAAPLRKTTKGGKLYQRRAEVEQLIDELEALPAKESVQRCKNCENPVPLEVLLYFMRKKNESLNLHYFEIVFTAFFYRLESALKRKIPDWM